MCIFQKQEAKGWRDREEGLEGPRRSWEEEGDGELGEEAGEVRPLCLCRQKTLEGTGKGNGKPEGWEVAGVAERDLSTTDFKILIP